MQQKGALRMFQYSTFQRNSILHLIFFIASMYILLHIVAVVFLILTEVEKDSYDRLIVPNIGISTWSALLEKPWTLITYSITHKSFFEMGTNLLWLYVFGNVIQHIIGHKEIIFYYFFAAIISGLLYLVCTLLLPSISFPYVASAMTVTVAMAFGALAVAPKKAILYLGAVFGIPLWMLVIAFMLLTGLFVGLDNVGMWILIAINAIVGFSFGKYLLSGARPGTALYDKYVNVNEQFYGAEHKVDGWRLDKLEQSLRSNNDTLSENQIQYLLEKIKKEGVAGLTIGERSMIFRSADQ